MGRYTGSRDETVNGYYKRQSLLEEGEPRDWVGKDDGFPSALEYAPATIEKDDDVVSEIVPSYGD